MLENHSLSRDGDLQVKKGLGFSCGRQDEFLSQGVLQKEAVLFLGRNSAVPIIHFAVEVKVEIQKWAFSFSLQLLREALQVQGGWARGLLQQGHTSSAQAPEEVSFSVNCAWPRLWFLGFHIGHRWTINLQQAAVFLLALRHHIVLNKKELWFPYEGRTFVPHEYPPDMMQG